MPRSMKESFQARALRIEEARLRAEVEREKARAAYWRAAGKKFDAEKKKIQERINAAKLQAQEDREISRKERAQRLQQEREDKALREELKRGWLDEEEAAKKAKAS